MEAKSTNSNRERFLRYGVAIVCAALSLGLRFLLFDVLGFTVPYMTFFLGVIVAARYGGLGPGILTTLLSALGAVFFLIEPAHSWKLATWAEAAGLALFLTIGTVMSWLTDALRRSQTLAQERLELVERERQWSAVTLTSIGDAVITTDALGRVTLLNPVAQSLTGWTEPEAAGRPLSEIFTILDEQTHAPAESPLQKILEAKSVARLSHDMILRKKDGTEIPIALSCAPIRDSSGESIGVVFTFRDIAEPRRTEKALRESEERFRFGLNAAEVGTWDWNVMTGEVSRSENMERIHCLPPGYFAGLFETFLEDIHPDHRPRVEAALKNALDGAGNYHVEYLQARADGQESWMEGKGRVIFEDGRPVRMNGICANITSRKRSEAERERLLLESKAAQRDAERQREHLRSLFQQAPALVNIQRGPDHVYEFVHPLTKQLLGGRDVTGLPAREALPEVDAQSFLQLLDKVYASGQPHLGTEVPAIRTTPAGVSEELFFNFIYNPWRDLEGNIAGVMTFAIEVTDQVRSKRAMQAAQTELERSNEMLRAVIENSPLAIGAIDLNGHVRLWNPAAERMFGWSCREVLEGDLRTVPDDLKDDHLQLIKRVKSGETVLDYETRRLTRTGATLDVGMSLSPLRTPEGEVHGVLAIVTDVSDRKRAGQQLIETAKLESLGVLAGGIAHDFNNLLVGILGNASLALETIPPDNMAHPLMYELIAASERAATLTGQMLAYSGKGRFVVKVVDLSVLVREIAGLLKASIPRTVQLRTQFDSRLPAIEVDMAQIQQLVMNLVINAAEACGDSPGTVRIVTTSQTVDPYAIQTMSLGGIQPGEYVCLEVTDTGCGMDEATQAKIFDPFFTTKFTGRGLGLAAALGIVRGHKGAIRIYSRPGKGSTFQVFFPAATHAVVKSIPEEIKDLYGSGKILVVDDEQLVRDTARTSLERYGYTVLTADDGEKGVQLFQTMPDEIAAVLLDASMPVMSGEQTLKELQKIRHGVSVILTSGFDEVEAVRRFEGQGLAGFLQKPFTPVRLAEQVKAVLDGQAEVFSTSELPGR